MMRFAIAAAAAMLASPAAFAGDVYDFKIGGQSIHIEQPRDCNAPSCTTVSIPGIFEFDPKRKSARDTDSDPSAINGSKNDADTRPAPTDKASAPSTSVAAASPVGVWQTEEKDGRVRIEDCGGNLCGYAVDAKTSAKGEQVLIDMKPGTDKWSGRIHDPKSGGNYDSTIAMNGSDRLKVQGCALGGLFCGGQTWTRTN